MLRELLHFSLDGEFTFSGILYAMYIYFCGFIDLLNLLISFLYSFRGYNWFWIYLVGPHVGAILGVGIFHLFLKSDGATNDTTRLESPVVDLEHGLGKDLDVAWQLDETLDTEPDIHKLEKENPPRYSVAYASSRPQLGRGLSCPVVGMGR